MEKLPKFKSAKEEAEFWETHSPVDFADQFEEVKEPIVDRRGRKKGIYIRIDPEAIDLARSVGANLGLGYQTLFRMWIMEGLGRHLTHSGGETTSSLPATLSDMSPRSLRVMLLEHLASCGAMAQSSQGEYGRRSPSRSASRRPAGGGGKHVAPGVPGVTSKIHVGTGRMIAERELSRGLDEALRWCLEMEPWRISVEVNKGVAYLSGRVPSWEYAREAEDLVRWHPQITHVVNRLTVDTPAAAWAGGEADEQPA